MVASKNSNKDSNNSLKYLSALMLIVAGLLVGYAALHENEKVQIVDISRSKVFEEQVNRHLFFTNQNIEMQKEKVKLQNSDLAPAIESSRAQNRYQSDTNGVDLNSDNSAYEVAKELKRGETSFAEPQTPHDQVQTELFNQKQAQEYSEAYKKEYARRFVENAAKNGWQVKLNDDFKVISVKPIRTPTSQPELSNTGGGSSQ